MRVDDRCQAHRCAGGGVGSTRITGPELAATNRSGRFPAARRAPRSKGRGRLVPARAGGQRSPRRRRRPSPSTGTVVCGHDALPSPAAAGARTGPAPADRRPASARRETGLRSNPRSARARGEYGCAWTTDVKRTDAPVVVWDLRGSQGPNSPRRIAPAGFRLRGARLAPRAAAVWCRPVQEGSAHPDVAAARPPLQVLWSADTTPSRAPPLPARAPDRHQPTAVPLPRGGKPACARTLAPLVPAAS